MKKANFTLMPFIILATLLGFLAYELFHAKPQALPSALIGQSLPNFRLPSLLEPGKNFSAAELQGRVSLLNIWATWCSACRIEHETLIIINQRDHVPLFSIDYKDNPEDAKLWLKNLGNPYEKIGEDTQGDLGIDLGIYGTPETFIIDKQGKIRYRHVGALDENTWQEVLLPLVRQYERE